MSETDSEFESIPETPRNPEEQPLAVAGKSFNELLEDQIIESSHVVSPKSLKVYNCNFYTSRNSKHLIQPWKLNYAIKNLSL